MKIVIDLTSLADNFSGIERYTLNISKEMIKIDKKNQYILIFKNSVHPSFNSIKDRKNVEVKILYGEGRVFFSQIKLAKALYKIKADRYLFLAFPGPILFRRRGIINAIHDLTAWDYPETMKFLSRIYFKAGILNAIRTSKNIITVSEFSKKGIMEKFNINNIDIIYNGISEVFIENKETMNDTKKSKVKKKYSLPDKYFMCLCTLEPRKNIELLIRAFLELKQCNKIDEKLVLVGRKGWKIEKLLEEVNDKYRNEIIVTGFVDDMDLPSIYSMAECFIFPSLYEGFGIPVIEAMYMNVPVICSDSSSLPEVVNGNGILFKNNDKEDLKRRIIDFKNENDVILSDFMIKAKNRAESFRWDKEARKLIDLLDV